MGRPPNQPLIRPKLREMLLRKAAQDKNMSQIEAIIQKNIDLALAGDAEARDFLFNRLEGKVADQIAASVHETNPLTNLIAEIARRNNRLGPALRDEVEDAEIIEDEQ